MGPSREMFAPLALFLFMIMSTINYTLQIAFHFVCVYCLIIDPINRVVIFCLTIFLFLNDYLRIQTTFQMNKMT